MLFLSMREKSMNKRIEELAKEAYRTTRLSYPDVDLGFGVALTLEKMAYLIVEECIDEANRNGDNILYLHEYFKDQ